MDPRQVMPDANRSEDNGIGRLVPQYARPTGVPKSLVCRPQMYITGEIESAAVGCCGTSFQQLYCSYKLRFSRQNWWLLAGSGSGETFSANLFSTGVSPVCTWNHPLEAHFVAVSLNGWPRLEVCVRGQDAYGRNQLVGYGSVFIPTKPGTHELILQCWRPLECDSSDRSLRQTLLGETPDFLESQMGNISQPNRSRPHIRAENSVEVLLRLNIILQYFKLNNIHT